MGHMAGSAVSSGMRTAAQLQFSKHWKKHWEASEDQQELPTISSIPIAISSAVHRVPTLMTGLGRGRTLEPGLDSALPWKGMVEKV
ncbi:hypothetical protein GQ607_006655 [Colletotrichum asianum]|uniref:Uncharacterized protein n=1 Tax=Colletotrichum asianum TaxID=702518 RepID=A0A8H3WKD7_9PEZI|nr:hypothetical protein GQ607_006655 [Colletotrichum asianum]